MIRHYKLIFKGLAFICLNWSVLQAQTEANLVFFESKVRPIFENNCLECHGVEKQKGGLALHLKSLVFSGGDSGSPIKKGDAKNSLMIKAVERLDEDFQMPPKTALSDENVQILKQWINTGAFWPDDKIVDSNKLPAARRIAESREEHWSFRPVKKSSDDTLSIDKLLDEKRSSVGLGLSPQASPRVLIRRAFYNLIGLPPSHDEVVEFEKNFSKQAYVELVDDLLTKPEYGEHWARHWLDVARYADTKGAVPITEELRYPYSFTYRDYVVNALNKDLPYNQFIKEQLAADLLKGHKKESLAALGFITVGRRSRIKDDIIDERIDATTRAFMGLTVSCARCHDHKFDPITIKDYYALYGVFKSIYEPGKDELPIIGHHSNEDVINDYKKKLLPLEEGLKKVTLRLIDKVEGEHKKGMKDYLLYYVKTKTKWKWKKDVKMKGDSVFLRKRTVGHRADHISKLRKDHFFFGPFVEFKSYEKADFKKRVKSWVQSEKSDSFIVNYLKNSYKLKEWRTLFDVANAYGDLMLNKDKWNFKEEDKKRLADYLEEHWVDVKYSQLKSFLEVGMEVTDYTKAKRKIDLLEAKEMGAPYRAMMVKDRSKPHNPNVFIRGNSARLGPAVTRRFLELLSPIVGGSKFEKGSGRLELAEAIAHPKNPLTARVMVNRVWDWHFGSPLVRTPSDFGLQAEKPEQLELLDFLAESFINSGWSIKALHRMIMTSDAYQQMSDKNSDAYEKDPDNNYYWRMSPKPLEYEQMRDAVLKVSNQLNLEKGGRPQVIESQHKRRALYTVVDRNEIPAEFTSFGAADPNGTVSKRITTLVPQQALYFMNNEFFIKSAQSLLNHPSLKNKVGKEWIQSIYQLSLQRDAAEDEVTWLQSFLGNAEQDTSLDSRYEWKYGYRNIMAKDKKESKFFKLFAYVKGQYNFPPKLKSKGFAASNVSREGGTTPPHGYVAIRRWTSPITGQIQIHSKIIKNEKVTVSLIKNENEEVFNKPMSEMKSDTIRLQVKKGDILDFSAGTKEKGGVQKYEWELEITATGRKWNSSSDFGRYPEPKIKYSNRLAIAQILLSSNEFHYLD